MPAFLQGGLKNPSPPPPAPRTTRATPPFPDPMSGPSRALRGAAAHWRAIGAHPPAREDPRIRLRLHHIVLVQRVFFWAVGDRQQPFAATKAEDFASFDALEQYAREHHAYMTAFMTGITDARLD